MHTQRDTVTEEVMAHLRAEAECAARRGPAAEPAQGELGWFAARALHIGASQAGTARGVNPHSSAKQLVRELAGMAPPFSERTLQCFAFGHAHEPLARDAYVLWRAAREGRAPTIVERGFVLQTERDEDIFLGASPDGLVDDDGLLEIKCPYSLAVQPVPETYKDQMCMQAGIVRPTATYVHFACWTPNDFRVVHFGVQDPTNGLLARWRGVVLPELRRFYYDEFLPFYAAAVVRGEALRPQELVRELARRGAAERGSEGAEEHASKRART